MVLKRVVQNAQKLFENFIKFVRNFVAKKCKKVLQKMELSPIISTVVTLIA